MGRLRPGSGRSWASLQSGGQAHEESVAGLPGVEGHTDAFGAVAEIFGGDGDTRG